MGSPRKLEQNWMHRRTKEINGKVLETRVQIMKLYVFYKCSIGFLLVFYAPSIPPRRGDMSCATWTTASILMCKLDTQRYDVRFPLHGFRYTTIIQYVANTCRKHVCFLTFYFAQQLEHWLSTERQLEKCAIMSSSKTKNLNLTSWTN